MQQSLQFSMHVDDVERRLDSAARDTRPGAPCIDDHDIASPQSQQCTAPSLKGTASHAYTAPEPQAAVKSSFEQARCGTTPSDNLKHPVCDEGVPKAGDPNRKLCAWSGLRSWMEDAGMCNPCCCLLWAVCCPCVCSCTLVAVCKYAVRCEKDEIIAKCCPVDDRQPETSNQGTSAKGMDS